MTVEAMEVLPEVLNMIGFETGILLGHSDGATISAIYGGMSGDLRVRGLVLIAPHFFTEPVDLASIADAYGTLAQTREIEDRIYSPVDVSILEDCGHSPHREFPEATLNLVAKFAERLQRIEDVEVLVS